ncbi:MAG: calcium-binding protein [Roseobacter sp.]
MTKVSFVAGIAICAVVLASGVAVAKSGHDHERISFETLDVDGDSMINPDEMANLRLRQIMRADANGDGTLSLGELSARGEDTAKNRAEKMMSRLDTNEDGVLSPEELTGGKRQARGFERVDQNGDGMISKEEFETAGAKMGKRKPKSE